MKILEKFLSEELKLDASIYKRSFFDYEKILLDWNTKINLVSRKTESIEEHILNSIFFLTKYDFKKIKKFADIGTGGGFPGIPLKILFPETGALLVDSIQKKINVVQDIIIKMNLTGIKAVCGRAEMISTDTTHFEKYDCVISKAVAPLADLYQWGRDFLKPTGEMVCIKGGDIAEEIPALNKLKYKFNTEVIKFDFDPVYKIEDKKIVVIRSSE